MHLLCSRHRTTVALTLALVSVLNLPGCDTQSPAPPLQHDAPAPTASVASTDESVEPVADFAFSSNEELPVWSVAEADLSTLAAPFEMSPFEIRPPVDFRFIRYVAEANSYYWIGPVRDDETYAQLIVMFTDLAEDDADKPLAVLLQQTLSSIRERRSNWLQTAIEEGRVNGMPFARATWSGVVTSAAREGLSGRTMHGVVYLTVHERTTIQVMCQDVGPGHADSLRLGELAALTFQVLKESPETLEEAIAAIEAVNGTVLVAEDGNVTGVSLRQTPRVDAMLGLLAQQLGVNAEPTPQVTDAELEHLKVMPEMQVLMLGNTQVSDAGLEHLAGLTNLTSLRLEGTRVTDAGLEHLQGMTRLESLCLSDTRIAGTGLEHLEDMTNLQSLWLDGTQLTDTGLGHLKGLTNLQSLRVRGTQVTDAGLASLKDLTNLIHLDLNETSVTDDGLEHLTALNLRSLYLSGTGVTDSGLVHLKELTRLGSLWLSNTLVTDRGLTQLEGLTDLQQLLLDKTQVADDGLKQLSQLPVLQHLSIAGTQITDDGLIHLRKLTGLQSLNLSDTQVTDAGLQQLHGLSSLQSLQLNGTNVSDEGLLHLTGLTDLRQLRIQDTQITDAGLQHLSQLQNLRELWLDDTRVTDDGIQEFEAASPDCRVFGTPAH